MGYNLSARSIHKVELYLQQMVDSSADITWTPPEGVTTFYLAFWIREGIRAAEALHLKNPTFTKYVGLLNKYTIRQRPTTVVAEFKLSQLQLLQVSMGVMTLDEPDDTLAVIGAAMKHKATKMHFPNAAPDQALWNWTQRNGYKIVDGDGLTLTKEALGEVEEWKP